MILKILSVLALLLTCAIGIWKYVARKHEFKRKEAEKAKEELDNANKTDDPSSFLDGFGRV